MGGRRIALLVFPDWTNRLRGLVLACLVVAAVYAGLLVAYGASTETTDVGYAPVQPIPYSHALHAGELGTDCRYCHVTVEVAAQAALPPTQTCINCHAREHGPRADSPKLVALREAYYGGGSPVAWVRVHDLPDYVYFDHSAHVRRGVGCVSCHGRVDRMEVVYQAKRLSMSWCLECHRNPAPNLRPLEAVTDMLWAPPRGAAAEAYGQDLMRQYNIRDPDYLTSCSICHH